MAFIDMDGVVADFVGGIAKAHNKPYPYDEHHGEDAWHLDKLWGMTQKELFEPCGYDFWVNLDKTPEADMIVGTIEEELSADRVAFLTSPTRNHGCMDGKRDWLKKYYPDFPVFFSVGSGGIPPKWMLARPYCMLVEDNSDNARAFQAAGGEALVVPRPWNHLHKQCGTFTEGAIRKFILDRLRF
jgi:5'(3')-deoxyribonucleotidase